MTDTETRLTALLAEAQHHYCMVGGRAAKANVAALTDALAAVRAVEKLRADLTEARQFGEHAASEYNSLLVKDRLLRCAFCDEPYPEGVGQEAKAALAAHISTCAQHPMRSLESGIRDVVKTLTMPMATYSARGDGGNYVAVKVGDWVGRRDLVKEDLEALLTSASGTDERTEGPQG